MLHYTMVVYRIFLAYKTSFRFTFLKLQMGEKTVSIGIQTYDFKIGNRCCVWRAREKNYLYSFYRNNDNIWEIYGKYVF